MYTNVDKCRHVLRHVRDTLFLLPCTVLRRSTSTSQQLCKLQCKTTRYVVFLLRVPTGSQRDEQIVLVLRSTNTSSKRIKNLSHVCSEECQEVRTLSTGTGSLERVYRQTGRVKRRDAYSTGTVILFFVFFTTVKVFCSTSTAQIQMSMMPWWTRRDDENRDTGSTCTVQGICSTVVHPRKISSYCGTCLQFCRHQQLSTFVYMWLHVSTILQTPKAVYICLQFELSHWAFQGS